MFRWNGVQHNGCIGSDHQDAYTVCHLSYYMYHNIPAQVITHRPNDPGPVQTDTCRTTMICSPIGPYLFSTTLSSWFCSNFFISFYWCTVFQDSAPCWFHLLSQAAYFTIRPCCLGQYKTLSANTAQYSKLHHIQLFNKSLIFTVSIHFPRQYGETVFLLSADSVPYCLPDSANHCLQVWH